MSKQGHEFLCETYARFFGQLPDRRLEEWEVAREILLSHRPAPPDFTFDERQHLLRLVQEEVEAPEDVREHFEEIVTDEIVA